ncbi:MAG: hypothetical protein JW881_09485 [Spirochaetales bacterium]|nr:hypothetical protein [Spirochaetales bacterium]
MMKELRKRLISLSENHSLIGIKGGTEVEDMTFGELRLMRAVSRDILPMTVKIGGAEARNDIRFVCDIGVDRILAPMIESAYALSNFIETVREIDREVKCSLAINIETATAFYSLKAMAAQSCFGSLEHITIGRTDLSASLGRQCDDEEITVISQQIIAFARFYGKSVSVGGKITNENCMMIRDRIKPDAINTRHMYLSSSSQHMERDVEAVIDWENRFYQFLSGYYPHKAHFYDERIRSNNMRIGRESALVNK